jgi:protein SCO1/2
MSLLRGALLALVATLAGIAWLWTSRAIALPEYGELPQLQLSDERGATVTRESFTGKVHVVDFIFTSCPTACPLLTAEMARLQHDLGERGLDDEVELFSISVDPERDTPERLRAYGAAHGADPRTWRFLRGDEQQLKHVVVDGMKQAIEREPGPRAPKGEVDDFGFVHGTKLVLLDDHARIRGFYDANDAASMKTLRDDIAALAGGRVTLPRVR